MSVDFVLDPRLQSDCIVLGHLPFSELLLMDRRALPWFVLVPRTGQRELYQLPASHQAQLLHEINRLSEFVHALEGVEKLNVAAIGNIVEQMHVHVVGRQTGDPCWPGVVWGRIPEQRYTAVASVQLVEQAHAFWAGELSRVPARPGLTET